jgi:hypothetical protein
MACRTVAAFDRLLPARVWEPVISGTLIFFAFFEERQNPFIEVGKSGARAAALFREVLKKWRISRPFSLVAFFNGLNKFANCKKKGAARSSRG